MNVPEYLRELRDTFTGNDEGDMLSEIAERWEKMEKALTRVARMGIGEDGDDCCPHCRWLVDDGHYAECFIGLALAAARAPLGEKTDG